MISSRSKTWGDCYGKHPVTQWPRISTLGIQLAETAITFICLVAMGSKMNKRSTGHSEGSAREQQVLGTTVFFSPTRGFSDITVNENARYKGVYAVWFIYVDFKHRQIGLLLLEGEFMVVCGESVIGSEIQRASWRFCCFLWMLVSQVGKIHQVCTGDLCTLLFWCIPFLL